MIKTTAIDDDVEQNLRFIVQRHAYDFNDLVDPVAQRIVTTIGRHPEGCHYFNPAVTISCPQPNKAFFARVQQEQARWCRTASETIRKRERRTVKAWVSHERKRDKYARYLDRALSFTGILFIDGKMTSRQQYRKRGSCETEMSIQAQ